MPSESQAVLVFETDYSVNVFESLLAAEGWVEAVDVLAGEYPAIFTHQGYVVTASVSGEVVTMTVTDELSLDGLVDWLARLLPPVTGLRTPEEIRRFANGRLRQQWSGRLPTRPQWLHRRLYGSVPPQV